MSFGKGKHKYKNFINSFILCFFNPEGPTDLLDRRNLILYLNFDDTYQGKARDMSYHGNAADLGKRTDITNSLSLCGKVARINEGGSVSFDGGSIQVWKNL